MKTRLTGWLTLIAALFLFACAATVAGRFGYRLGTDHIDRWVLAAVCVVAALLCLLMFNIASTFWRQGQAGAAIAAGLVWSFAVCVDLTGAVGFSAANRAESVAESTKHTLVFEDSRATVQALETERAGIVERLAFLKEQRPPAAVAGDLAKAEAGRHFAATKGCTAILTRRQRKACEAYASLKAEAGMAAEVASLRAKLPGLIEQIARARSGSQAVDTTAATSQAQGVVLASILTGSRAPSEDAIWWTTVGLCVLLAGMLLCSGLTWDAALRMLGIAQESVPVTIPKRDGEDGTKATHDLTAGPTPARPPLEVVRKVREAYAATSGLYGGVKIQAVAA